MRMITAGPVEGSSVSGSRDGKGSWPGTPVTTLSQFSFNQAITGSRHFRSLLA